ncbi:uncharacterized protein LAESUDRAFT_727153 [Laetiporus sulphureus 93-53]|uniref:C2H2-type domain-containing protein n=1 Tax=Laetiporus sulphureus 93-53 TaxID=1314785 RepID=A0A165DMP5_9APHY|nr:uncharacterized protein LAESUDRAFT_727153 [Laetiporus sulphureus 93-53]KZT05213.1 hypothetical protein LAESUDRAFT_727153 [Laetiporus sulphureus 93-53]
MELDGEVNASDPSGSKNPWDRFLESARYLKGIRHSFPRRQPYPIPSDQLNRVRVYPHESNDEAMSRSQDDWTGVWVDLLKEDESRLNTPNTVLLGSSQRNFKSNQREAIQASWLPMSTFSGKNQLENVPLCHRQDLRVREADTAASPGSGRVPLASLSNASSLLPPRPASQAKKVNHVRGNTTKKARSSPRTSKAHRNIIVQLQLNKSASARAPQRKERTRADKSVALRTCPYAGCESAGDAHTMWCHLKTVHCVGDTMRCPFEFCDSTFRDASSVRRHVMTVHWKAPGIFDVCARCGMVQRTDVMSLHVLLCKGEADQGNESC